MKFIKAVFILLPESNMMLLCGRLCIYVYKIAVVGFNPHAYNAEVFAKNACSHLTQCLGPIKEVIA